MKFPFSNRKSTVQWAVFAALCAMLPGAFAADETFDVVRFQVEGNTLLPKSRVEEVVLPYVGRKKVYGDIQKALEALEHTYRELGYGTVQVYAPEQELTSGVVKLQVSEGFVGTVQITGNKFFTEENIRASLPKLKENTAPNLREISESVQLANESSAKQIEVALAVGAVEGAVDAKISVVDENPRKVIFTLDNTGNDSTGQYRLGVAYRDANVFGHDESVTLGYTTAPDSPGGFDLSSPKLNAYSVGVRVPFYDLGDSLDLIWGYNSLNTLAQAGGGPLGTSFNAKGTIWAVRWNHLFARQGEYSSRLVFGFDQKDVLDPCPPALSGTAGCVTHSASPVSLTYSGQWAGAESVIDFNVGAAYNTGLFGPQTEAKYLLAAANRSAPVNYLILKGGGSYSRPLSGDWQLRAAISGQYSTTPLISTEQFGIAGANTVRGFAERAVAVDRGLILNLEAYTPDFASSIPQLSGSLRGLFFIDSSYGENRVASGPGFTSSNLASLGAGLRYSYKKDIGARIDWARVVTAPYASGTSAPIDSDWRVHFAVSVGF